MVRKVTVTFLLCLAVPLYSQNAVSLDEAIRSSVVGIAGSLEGGARVAVVNFSADSVNMSEYALRELNNALVNQGNLVVVGRGADLELAQVELRFNLSGDVSDETAQAIGRFLGAQVVVSGSLGVAGDHYRFTVQALEVETAVIRYSRTVNVANDRLVSGLMGERGIVADFTPAERAGAAALNLALGAGSFAVQKDTKGGTITAILEGLGAAAVLVSPLLVRDVQRTDPWTGLWYSYRDTSVSAPMFYAGIGVFAVGAIYGVYRAISYQKPRGK